MVGESDVRSWLPAEEMMFELDRQVPMKNVASLPNGWKQIKYLKNDKIELGNGRADNRLSGSNDRMATNYVTR